MNSQDELVQEILINLHHLTLVQIIHHFILVMDGIKLTANGMDNDQDADDDALNKDLLILEPSLLIKISIVMEILTIIVTFLKTLKNFNEELQRPKREVMLRLYHVT